MSEGLTSGHFGETFLCEIVSRGPNLEESLLIFLTGSSGLETLL